MDKSLLFKMSSYFLHLIINELNNKLKKDKIKNNNIQINNNKSNEINNNKIKELN